MMMMMMMMMMIIIIIIIIDNSNKYNVNIQNSFAGPGGFGTQPAPSRSVRLNYL
jgi:hypothetical protein